MDGVKLAQVSRTGPPTTTSRRRADDLSAAAADHPLLRFVAKPVLAPSMIVYLLRAKRYDLVTVALVFAWAGDVAMLRRDRAGFLTGLTLFSGTQLSLLLAFLRRSRPRWPVFLGGGLAWLTGNALLWRRLEGLRVPMLGYSLALTAMACAATGRGPRIAAGGGLFLTSDVLIALRKAGLRLPAHDALIMSTYTAALALITTGWAGDSRLLEQ